MRRRACRRAFSQSKLLNSLDQNFGKSVHSLGLSLNRVTHACRVVRVIKGASAAFDLICPNSQSFSKANKTLIPFLGTTVAHKLNSAVANCLALFYKGLPEGKLIIAISPSFSFSIFLLSFSFVLFFFCWGLSSYCTLGFFSFHFRENILLCSKAIKIRLNYDSSASPRYCSQSEGFRLCTNPHFNLRIKIPGKRFTTLFVSFSCFRHG